MNKYFSQLILNAHDKVNEFKERVQDERGATTVEYVMILGIMAILVAFLFLNPGGIRDGIENLGRKVIDAIGDATSGGDSTY